MTELLTAAQMRAIEAAAIASGAVTGLELMERAGRGVVEAIFEEWAELGEAGGAAPRPPGYLGTEEGRRAVVLCGPGNNGGDGFVVARLLRELGWGVEVFLYGTPEGMPPDARVNYERWRAMGEVRGLSYPDIPEDQIWPIVEEMTSLDPALLIDAIFGTGLTRPVTQGLQSLFQVIDMNIGMDRRDVTRLVSVDMPSGACSDSGICLDFQEDRFSDYNVFRANLTVTFETAKIGHYLEECPHYCGKIVIKRLGVWKSRPQPDNGVRLTSLAWFHGFSPLNKLEKWSHDHKYTHGHALILSGPPGHGGAARLAARGALRIGAGVVTVGCVAASVAEHSARMDAVMVRVVGDAGALAGVLEDRRINAICLGPGLGLDGRAVGMVANALAVLIHAPWTDGNKGPPFLSETERGERRRVVLDADALTLLAQNPSLFAALHGNCVLTPHAGEFARLFPDIAAKLAAPATRGPAYSKVDATREAAARAGCVVLFKGPDTVIADPSGRCSINAAYYERAAPWLATAGSGDVLAGFITGLLARGFQPMQAAETAAWLHVECARSFGPGLIAEDLPEELPKVFRALGL